MAAASATLGVREVTTTRSTARKPATETTAATAMTAVRPSRPAPGPRCAKPPKGGASRYQTSSRYTVAHPKAKGGKPRNPNRGISKSLSSSKKGTV